jgi:septum formation protein
MRPVADGTLVLASQSPRRIELLKRIVADFAVLPSDVEERINPALTPEQNALALAEEKARAIAQLCPGVYILGADTLVVLANEVFGKPLDRADAQRILRLLQGQTHQVITGVAVIGPQGRAYCVAAVSHVRFNPVTEREMERYIDSGEPMDKAGAYAIQGKGAFMVQGHDGSFSNIVGLPLATTYRLLESAGFPNLAPQRPAITD